MKPVIELAESRHFHVAEIDVEADGDLGPCTVVGDTRAVAAVVAAVKLLKDVRQAWELYGARVDAPRIHIRGDGGDTSLDDLRRAIRELADIAWAAEEKAIATALHTLARRVGAGDGDGPIA